MKGRGVGVNRTSTSLHSLTALTLSELREQRDFSVMGLIKWVVEPISYMIVYFVLVAAILNRPRDAYPLFLLCALVPWRYFTGVIFDSMFVIRRYAEVIQNRSFARELLPVSLMLSEMASFGIALALFVPMMLFYEVAFGWHLLWIPVLIAILMILASGPAFFTAMFGLYYPDLRGVFQNLVRVLFFVSSGLVPLREIPGDELPSALAANPLSGVFDSFRAVFLRSRSPAARDLLYPLAIGLVLLAINFWFYRRRRYEFAKEV